MADLVAIAKDLVQACEARDWNRAYANADPKFAAAETEFIMGETFGRVRAVAGTLVQIVRTHELRHLLAAVQTVFVVCKYQRCVVTYQVGFFNGKILGLAILTPDFT